ncbi:MAG: ATP-binding protein [Desulfovibrio sp.]|nr:ATP-binding protein [Desulfovibrio sp.]
MLAPSSEEKFIRACTARWLLRLIDSGVTFSDYFFGCAGWVMGGMRTLAETILREVKAPGGRARDLTMARADLKQLADRHSRIDDALEELYHHECLQSQIRALLTGQLEAVAKSSGKLTDQKLYKRLHSLFGLDSRACEVCLFAFALGQYSALEYLFEDTLEIMRHCNRTLFARVLGLSGGALSDIRYSLESMGILESGRNSIRLSESVEYALLVPGANTLRTLFCRPLAETDVRIDEFHISEEDRRHALALMKADSDRPVHILLYGAPGSGKTSFASAIARETGLRAWSAECGTKDNTQDRRASLAACLKVAMQTPGAFVLVDEAERLLDTSDGDLREVSAKAWINELLERKNTRIVWITNRVDHLDPAVRRRFSYSIHFRSLGTAESRSMWNAVAKRTEAEAALPQEARDRFAQLYPVPVATMEMAIRQAQALAGPGEFTSWVERVLKAQTTLQNDGLPQKKRCEGKFVFDCDAVCVSTPAGEFLDSAKCLAEKMAATPEPGLGTMLFYGPPGTGKTALARHTARSLGVELIVRRASDLIDPFVGMTERNIAQAFATAEADRALLLIDEADSFIFGREGAQHSWETTMVNEFLTQLEEYAGLCVCTTNFRNYLDPAAMRRFTIKLEFAYAGPRQIELLYRKILQPLAGSEPDEALLARLCSQKNLAPGDFKAVRQRMWIRKDVTHAMLAEELLRETKLKLEAKNVGF